MRKTIGFIAALGAVGGGLYLIIAPLYAGWFSGLMLLSGGSMLAIGTAWLWGDYFDPERQD